MAPKNPRSLSRAGTAKNEIRIAWLLLLLDEDATYGYELRRQLAAHRLTTDAAWIYRTLRQLERDGWLQSRWMRPSAGPSRRLYRLTDAGRQHLDGVADTIDDIRDSHEQFMRAYHRALKRRLDSATTESSESA